MIPAPLFAQSADEKKATIQFLVGLQQSDGGFVPRRPTGAWTRRRDRRSGRRRPPCRAIRYLGGEVPNKDKALAFVKSCLNADTGAFADTPGGKEELAATAVGMMALAALQPDASHEKSIAYLRRRAKTFEDRRLAVAGMEAAGTFPPEVVDWVAEVNRGSNPDGTFGKDAGLPRETGSIAAMILRSGQKLDIDQRKAIVKALKDGQRPDGGYGKAEAKDSDPETTYRVMRAFYLLKEKPKDVAQLKAYIAKHRNADGGYSRPRPAVHRQRHVLRRGDWTLVGQIVQCRIAQLANASG